MPHELQRMSAAIKNELEDICGKIAVELRNQYVLGYRPTNEAKDGKFRKIRLKVNPPKGISGLSVRGKSGYYAQALETDSISSRK